MGEEWKDIEGFEGLYQASSEGRIRSLGREVAGNAGSVWFRKGKTLKPVITRGGYLQVLLYKEGKHKWFSVHRLVYAAFNGEIPSGYDVNHIDEDKTNNRLDNLNLLTHKENLNFGTRNERIGKANAKANINNPLMSKPVIALDEDGKVIFEFPSAKEAGRHGFNSGGISNCCRSERRTHHGYRWRYKEELGNA